MAGESLGILTNAIGVGVEQSVELDQAGYFFFAMVST